jgi:hypothetical protein
MTTDFEEQLRARLQATAEEITPNPETWQKVQEGIRREQRFRWVYAGAGATALAALAAVAVLVVPGLLTRPDIGFAPGEVAGQPEGAPGDVAGPPDPGLPAPPTADLLVVTPEGRPALLGPGGFGEIDWPDGRSLESVAVRPGSTVDALDAVWAGGCEVGRLTRDRQRVDVSPLVTPAAGACATGPRFSPDGGHLAWIEEVDGAFRLATVGWDDTGEVPVRNAVFELSLEGADVEPPVDFRVIDWTWRAVEGGSATGYLALGATDPLGDRLALTLQIERQADGALAFPAGAEPERLESGELPVAALTADGCREVEEAPCPDGATYLLVVDEAGTVGLERQDEGEQIWTTTLNPLRGADLAAGPVWLELVGRTVLIGDGDRVWATSFTGDGWTELTELAVAAQHAAPLAMDGPELVPPPPAPDDGVHRHGPHCHLALLGGATARCCPPTSWRPRRGRLDHRRGGRSSTSRRRLRAGYSGRRSCRDRRACPTTTWASASAKARRSTSWAAPARPA